MIFGLNRQLGFDFRESRGCWTSKLFWGFDSTRYEVFVGIFCFQIGLDLDLL